MTRPSLPPNASATSWEPRSVAAMTASMLLMPLSAARRASATSLRMVYRRFAAAACRVMDMEAPFGSLVLKSFAPYTDMDPRSHGHANSQLRRRGLAGNDADANR